jgi:hypothetical protein
MDLWVKNNALVTNRLARENEELGWPFMEQKFMLRGEEHASEYEMQISLFAYTEAARKVDVPEPVMLRDIAAS